MSPPWIAVVTLLSLVTAALAAAFVLLSIRIEGVLKLVVTRLDTPELKPPGLQPGARVHPFSALRQDGTHLTDLDLQGHICVVLLLKADCVVCRTLSRQLTRQELDARGIGSNTYVIIRNERERDVLALDPNLEIAFQEDGAVAWAFRSSATPQAFVLDNDGVVAATGFPNSLDALDRLVRSAVNS